MTQCPLSRLQCALLSKTIEKASRRIRQLLRDNPGALVRSGLPVQIPANYIHYEQRLFEPPVSQNLGLAPGCHQPHCRASGSLDP